jgi:hypothetical protein
MTYGQIHTDHNQAMRDIKRDIDARPKDQLAGLLKALLDEPEVNQSVHLLAVVMRGIAPPPRPNSFGGRDSVATLAELAPGMLYQEREGKRMWLRIVEIGPVENFDSSGAQQYRDAVVQPAFSHQFAEARPMRIFGYEKPFPVKVAVGREPR